ncbi:MAG TPA: ABC transporter permease [Acidimicrobiales bacterium]|nr:ABC transporter permease [Acidimicrobiales bacterium]
MAGIAAGGARRSKWAPWALSAPALIWLVLFFVVPLYTLFTTSLSVNVGSVFVPELEMRWQLSNYTDAFREYGDILLRSFRYAGAATIFALILAYPLAYTLAFKAGKWKNALLGLVILPFFVTFLVRTLAWKTIFDDSGWVVSFFDTIGLLPSEGRLLSTSWAVIGGLTYNFLPFMILPIYVSLERIDPRLMEASRDLYSTGRRTFLKILLPLSLPGVFAGSLLTFIPASGDFINAQYLGGVNQSMIGSVIQSKFLIVKDYPTAAALSFVLMLLILAGVLAYTRALGTEDLK